MTVTTIWHNPRCSKSRQTLDLLNANNINVQIIEYLKNPPSFEDLQAVHHSIGGTITSMIRTKETIFSELGLNIKDDTNTLLQALVSHPKLIERPIVIHNGRAAIGRPPEAVLKLFD